MIHTDDELDRALGRLSESGEAGGSLEPYADSLLRLKALQAVPDRDPQAVSSGRRAFLSQVASAEPVSRATLSRHTLRNRDGRKELRPVNALLGLLVAVALLFGGGGATAFAAQDALPNDALYGVKLATEDVRLALTSDLGQQIALLEDWADRRVQEMQQVVQAGEGIPLETALRLQTQLKEALRIASQIQEPDLTPTLLRLQTRLETQLRTMEQLRTQDPNGAALQTAQQAMIQTRAELQGALEDPAAFRTRYGAGRPDDAPVQPEVTPGEPPVSVPGTGGQGSGQGNGQGNGPAATEEPITEDAAESAGSAGGYGPGDGTCICTPLGDGTELCTPNCFKYEGTASQNGFGLGGPNCECIPQADGMLLCQSTCEPNLYLWSTPGPNGFGGGGGHN